MVKTSYLSLSLLINYIFASRNQLRFDSVKYKTNNEEA